MPATIASPTPLRTQLPLTVRETATAEPRLSAPHPWQTQVWAKVVRRLMRGYAYTRWIKRYCDPLTVQGLENLNALDGPAIFIANHQSHMDTLVAYTAMPEQVKRNLFFGAAADRWYVLGKKKLVLQPWYQSLVLGNFPIVRGGGAKSLEYAKTLLSRGQHVFIFPEGTRTQRNELGRLKPGVALIALELGVPVVPLYLSGLREMRPKGALQPKAGPAGVDVLPVLRFEAGTTVEMATAAMQRVLTERHAIEQSMQARVDAQG